MTNKKKRVLAVDDDPSALSALRQILTQKGYDVVTAKNGDDALAMLDRDESIELVLLDINLPETDGFEILKRLKAYDRRRDTPVICLSARTAVEDKVEKALERCFAAKARNAARAKAASAARATKTAAAAPASAARVPAARRTAKAS